MAAALYTVPSTLVRVLEGAGAWWWWVVLAACVAVLLLWAAHLGSPLLVLGTIVLVGVAEVVVALGTAVADSCGDSRLASALEWSGGAAILLLLGTRAVRRRRLWLVAVALVPVGVWVAAVAHVIPGGAGACFD